MHEHETETAPELEGGAPTVVPTTDGEGDTPQSLLDSLRQRREELTETRDVFIPLPGYDAEPPILLAKYRLLEGHEINAIAKKVTRETKDSWTRQTLAAVDTFIAACTGMFVDLKDGQGPQPMTLNGNPILGYNQDLATALDFQSETARQTVYGVFADNDVAIMTHGARLSLWMGDTTRKIDEDFLGEV
jgi:hypothetical protein